MNTIMRKSLSAIALWAVLGVAGASAASAWTFATRSAPLMVYSAGTLAGQGAGALSQTGGSTVELTTDNKRNGYRTFIDVFGSTKVAGMSYTTSGQTGRRSDGEAAWATMAPHTLYGTYIGGYRFQVKVCEDHSLTPDFCSAIRLGSL